MQIITKSVTQKGQVTIPADFRKMLGIMPYSRVFVYVQGKAVKIEPTVDILDIAPIGKAPKGMNALKAREYMEKHYERF